MGANHQKEIAFLCTICEPDFGYITNFGKAHLEGFGGFKGVIKGKCELYTFLQENDKIAFVNPDDAVQLEKTKGMQTIHFKAADLLFLGVNPFVKLSYKDQIIQSNLIGNYNYANLAAAITIGAYFNVAKAAMKAAIESYVPKNNRSQIITTKNNKIILDAYNANPSSMQVALENFDEIHLENSVVILGDMFELGTESLQEHQAMVDLATSFNFDHTFFVGDIFFQTTTKKHQFRTYEQLEAYLKENRLTQQSILIKGSRGMRLERILGFID
jgi:UDP-N-acetylmuramoyl-tripeptide--D-alanyl-D-alanine ligase